MKLSNSRQQKTLVLVLATVFGLAASSSVFAAEAKDSFVCEAAVGLDDSTDMNPDTYVDWGPGEFELAAGESFSKEDRGIEIRVSSSDSAATATISAKYQGETVSTTKAFAPDADQVFAQLVIYERFYDAANALGQRFDPNAEECDDEGYCMATSVYVLCKR